MNLFRKGRHRVTRNSVTVPELVAEAHDCGELTLGGVFALPFSVWLAARPMTKAMADLQWGGVR